MMPRPPVFFAISCGRIQDSPKDKNLGLVLLQSGSLQKAETEFKEAARLKPQYAEGALQPRLSASSGRKKGGTRNRNLTGRISSRLSQKVALSEEFIDV